MPPTTKNLGLVKAIHAGLAPPSNTVMLWYDTNVGVKKQKYYDVVLGQWVLLASVSNQQIFTIKKSLTAAEIQTLNSIRIDTGIVEESGKVIDIMSCSRRLTYGTTPFTSTTIMLITDTASGGGFQFSVAGLDTPGNAFDKMFQNEAGGGGELLENKKVYILADSDSVGFGDSTVDLYIDYRIRTL